MFGWKILGSFESSSSAYEVDDSLSGMWQRMSKSSRPITASSIGSFQIVEAITALDFDFS